MGVCLCVCMWVCVHNIHYLLSALTLNTFVDNLSSGFVN